MPPLSGHVFPKPRGPVNPFSVLLSFDAVLPYLAISCHILPYLAISCPNSNLKPQQDSVAAASSDERDDQLVDPDRADPATFGAECADKLVEEPEATQLCHVRFDYHHNMAGKYLNGHVKPYYYNKNKEIFPLPCVITGGWPRKVCRLVTSGHLSLT